MTAKRTFWFALLGTLVVRVFLASRIPIIGDEAYYIMWGKYPALGYYDHPPMIGWLLALIRPLGTHPVALRLPAILLSLGVAPLILGTLRERVGEERAYLAAAFFLLAPVHALSFFLGIEVPLVFFSFLSVFFFDRSLRSGALRWPLAAGCSLGLAFLSKYFAVLIGFAYLIHTVFWRRTPQGWKNLALVALSSMPFVALHLAWNATHCWATVAFNLSGRNIGQGFRAENVWTFLIYQAYLLGPALLYAFARNFAAFKRLCTESSGALFITVYLVPILCFGYASFRASTGLHWFVNFYPFLYTAAGLALTAPALRTALRIQGAFVLLHVIPALVIVFLPVERWKDKGFYGGLMLSFHAPAIARELEASTPAGVPIASDGYTEASLLETFSNRRASVIGEGVLFGREDDILTDFRQWDGKDVLIFTRHARSPSEYAPYFESIDRVTHAWMGMDYYLFHGHRFRYSVYHDHILEGIRREHYVPVKGLPMAACYFTDRYF